MDPLSIISSVGGGLIGGVASLFGANQAADAQKQAAKLQQQQYQQNQTNLQPYMTAGGNALAKYSDSLGLNGSDAQKSYFDNFQTDPYYTKELKAGTNAIGNSYLARGGGYGGNALAAVNDYGAGLLKGAYDTRSGQLAGLAGQGQGAASSLATSGAYGANAAGNFVSQAGTSLGNGTIGAANSALRGINLYNYGNGNGNALTQYGYSTNPADYGGINYTDPMASYGNFANF